MFLDTYLVYNRIVCLSARLSLLVLWECGLSRAKSYHRRYIFIIMFVAVIALIRRKNASPGTRSVYNSTRRFCFEDKYMQFLSKVDLFLFVRLDGTLCDLKILN